MSVEKEEREMTEGVNALVDFLTEEEDGFGQVSNMAMGLVVMNLLLQRGLLSPLEMLRRVMQAPTNLCSSLFRELAAVYRDNRQNPKLWGEFGKAAGDLPLSEYFTRGMWSVEDAGVLPLIADALGLEEDKTIN